MPRTTTNGNGKRHATQQSLNAAVKSICDIVRRANCQGAMNYVPEMTWILFLRILDEREAHKAEEALHGGFRALHFRFPLGEGVPVADWTVENRGAVV